VASSWSATTAGACSTPIVRAVPAGPSVGGRAGGIIALVAKSWCAPAGQVFVVDVRSGRPVGYRTGG
jgi:hypothetical protein